MLKRKLHAFYIFFIFIGACLHFMCVSNSSPAGLKPELKGDYDLYILRQNAQVKIIGNTLQEKITNDPVISYLRTKNLYLQHTPLVNTRPCSLGLHLITSFPILYTLKTLEKGGFDNVKFRRQLEYLETLYNNVQNPCIAVVHIFGDKDLPSFLDHQPVINFTQYRNKLKFIKLDNRPANMSEIWDYAWNFLPQRVVAAANGDIFIKNGLEKINVDSMKTKHVAYSITRQPHPAVGLNDASMCVEDPQNYCNEYKGSHDFHMMYMDRPFPKGVLEALKFQMNSLGAENVLIHMWTERLNLTVLNPCKAITIIHNHCSGHRTYSDKRVDRVHGWLIGRVKGSNRVNIN